MNTLLSIIKEKWHIYSLITVILQQILIATATYLMADIAMNYTNLESSLTSFVLLGICLVLPGSLINYYLNIYLQKAENTSILRYLSIYSKKNYNNPTINTNQAELTSRHYFMTKDAQHCISECIYFVNDLVSLILNIILNTAAIVAVTNNALGFTILISGIIGIFLINLFDHKIKETVQKEIKSQNIFNKIVEESWDNITIGNKLHFNNWTKIFKQIFNSLANNKITKIKTSSLILSISSFIVNIAVVMVVFYEIYTNQNNHSYVIALLVMLPRSLQIAMHLQIVQSHFTNWKMLKERLINTDKSFSKIEVVDLTSQIKENSITIIGKDNKLQKYTVSEFITELPNLDKGRFSVVADNGKGKTSLLITLKSILGEKAIFIPAKHSLMNNNINNSKKSVGEKVISTLQETLKSETKVLLLDEWEANLSNKNIQLIERELEHKSKTALIIDVTHARYS